MSIKSVYLDKQITDVTKMYIRPSTIIAMNIFHCFIMWQLHEVNFFGSFLLASHSTSHVYLFGGIIWFERNYSYFEIRPISFKPLRSCEQPRDISKCGKHGYSISMLGWYKEINRCRNPPLKCGLRNIHIRWLSLTALKWII